jgi:hypothetical protein
MPSFHAKNCVTLQMEYVSATRTMNSSSVWVSTVTYSFGFSCSISFSLAASFARLSSDITERDIEVTEPTPVRCDAEVRYELVRDRDWAVVTVVSLSESEVSGVVPDSATMIPPFVRKVWRAQ